MFVSDSQIKQLRKLQKENKMKFESELKKIGASLFKQYCDKSHYKTECDQPCTMAYTNTCNYLKEMEKIRKEFGLTIH